VNDSHGHKSLMKAGWICPLCQLHGMFDNRDMVEKHLEWDHKEVGISWGDNEVGLSIRLRWSASDIRRADDIGTTRT
jgi:hypothetical protein